MATFTSHVLDSIEGNHASGIRISLVEVSGDQRTTLFDVEANEQGRIEEAVSVDSAARYELNFHAADYFRARGTHPEGRQIIDEIVVRISVPDPDERYHIPMMISPHAYSLWWSA